jgi:SNF2 family DNA or RNA helicase
MINIEIKQSEKLKAFEYCGFVTFNFDMNIVSAIKSLGYRMYNPDNKTWEIPFDSIAELKQKLSGYEFNITGKLVMPTPTENIIPDDFSYKTEPYEHQKVSLEYGMKYNRWFLGDEQGLGKTKQAIDIAIARKLKYGYKHCLIVCGVNTLKWNWVNEILIHSNELAFILGQKARRDGKIVIGSTNDKLADLQLIEKDSDNIQPYFIITNVESFRDEKIANTIKTLCDKKIINMCVADEMHKMKNPTSQQTKGFLKCLPECRIGMTGTPLMNNPLDLYVILRWLGYETHAFYSFKQHYCVMGGYGGYEIIGYRNMTELTNKVKSIMLRRLKADVLDLPEKIYVDEYVDMTPKQAVIYKEVECSIKANIDLIKSNNNPLSQLIRLRQATGYTGILSSEIQESAKLDRMEDLVEEAYANGQKCLIFSNWTQMTDAIYYKLSGGRFGISVITGDTKDEDRQRIVDLFQTSDKCNVLIGTIGAMGTGLTLTAATTIIFVDEPWNKALFDQAVDRAHRIGTTSNITIYSLMCKDTIDERIHQIIYKKGEMSDAIIDGKILGDKGMVIDYLLN